MWEYMELPVNEGDLQLREQLVERCVTAKMREHDGTVFLCCSPADKERIDTFTRSAQAVGRLIKNIRTDQMETTPQALVENVGKKAFFIYHTQQEYLNEYLAICPAGERHLVLYSRRFGNGPSPHMSAFMDFWMENNVDIWDLCNIDRAIKTEK